MQVLVIDDHPIVLEGCRQLLKYAGAKTIVQTESLTEGFQLYRSKKPDIIIVDLAMGTGALGGLSFIRRLRLHDNRTPVLVFSMHSDPFIVSQALKLGANGYILKDTSGDEIVKAFDAIRSGLPYLSHELASNVAFMEARGYTKNPLNAITERELQILSLLAEGKSYTQIAADLHVSYKTIANTCSQLKAKLCVRSFPELMRIAIENLPSIPGKTFKQ
ncbi:response regulator transcription factor [Methyloceanibacter sp.]|uniref:response regulator transcription factor n=1 Tax=Methyloceanibacter sp. TaxID=1965321 RepID=UPI00207F07D3|nr:response regulator transcription factor [Methyloceanibacter sp.]GFO81726.1 MAG: DNA-binding response regulator [Methyloceanibacter sp.]HML91056.1 response regulator transcription factor [Methyloceanibacter sp.]